MPKLQCTEPVCRHHWSEAQDPDVPRCPRCGSFWVRVEADTVKAQRNPVRSPRLLARGAFGLGR